MKTRAALVAVSLLLASCAGRDLAHEYRPHSGVVTAVEVVDVDRIDRQGGVRSSISIGVSSGGRRSTGIGMGIGFPLGGNDEKREIVRYEVDLVGEGPIVVYHPRRRFEIDDCVLVRIHPNAERHPPKIEGPSDDCGD